ncbi:MAG: diguanylate cyclase domain-containing protein, partial [Turicibacter sp.]
MVALAGLIMDINDRKERELEVKNQNTILQTVIDTIPNVIFYKDKDSRYIRTNKECKEFYNRMGTGNIIGKTDLEINPDRLLAEKMMQDDKRIIESKQVHFTEPTLRLPNGKVERREVVKAPVINDQDEVIGIVGLSRDITQKKELEDKLKYLSYTDILTGVYNRTCFEEKIKEFQQESCLPIGVIMGDVNGLKLVNDTLGHLEGDRLLISISSVLMRVFGNKGDIFRWGGDEFVILVPNTDNQKCEEFVEEIKRQCKLESGSDLIELSISLGVAIYTDVEMDIFDALKEAEEKVYRHKLLEQNSVVSSTLLSLQKSLEAKSMETELHTKRMLTNSMKIGRKMGLSMAQLDELALATKLHDIGKIGISEDI